MIEKNLLDKLAEKHDEKWDEVMNLARENGFIIQAFPGTATLISNKEQIANYGYEEYEKIQETNSTLDQINDLEDEECLD